jgi:hypothetical protein
MGLENVRDGEVGCTVLASIPSGGDSFFDTDIDNTTDNATVSSTADNDDGGLSGGAIAAIVIVVLLLILAGVVVFVVIKKRSMDQGKYVAEPVVVEGQVREHGGAIIKLPSVKRRNRLNTVTVQHQSVKRGTVHYDVPMAEDSTEYDAAIIATKPISAPIGHRSRGEAVSGADPREHVKHPYQHSDSKSETRSRTTSYGAATETGVSTIILEDAYQKMSHDKSEEHTSVSNPSYVHLGGNAPPQLPPENQAPVVNPAVAQYANQVAIDAVEAGVPVEV